MPEITKYEQGMFSWVELATSDWKSARTFYASLFGWTANEMPMGPGEPPYVMLEKNKKSVGALYENKNISPNWLSYITVTSADDSAKTAKDLGANLIAEPFDVMDVGRMATVQDPQGARFALWEARRHIGAGLRDEPNTLCWNELWTTDISAARDFYKALFDWTLKISEQYTEAYLGERGIGGLMQIRPEMGPMPPQWVPYFAVENCDAAVKKAQSAGGSVRMPVTDMPDVGRFALLADPQGAAFYVIELRSLR